MSQTVSTVVKNSPLSFEGATLPNGWRFIRLEDMVSPRNGYWGTEESFTSSIECLILGVGNITNDGDIKLEGAQRRYLSKYEQEAIALEGDLLVVKSSGSATNIRSGKAGLCPQELTGKIACSNFMIRLVVDRDIVDPYLLWRILNSNFAKKFVRQIAGSTTYPNIKWETYKNFTFPLPPLSEQKRLAAILKEQMAAVERARAAAEAQLKAANDLPDAYLREVFESPEAEQWEVKQLGELASPEKYAIKRGPFGGHLKKEIFVSSGYKVYEQGNAIKNDFNIGTYYITKQKYEELKAFKVQPGDVIISCSGTIGKVAVVPDGVESGIINQALLKVSLNHNLILPNFFKLVFESDHIKKQLKKLSYGSGLENVASVSQLKQVALPTPAIDAQAQIIKLYGDKVRLASQVLKSLQDRLYAINKLPAALLRQAFTGKL